MSSIGSGRSRPAGPARHKANALLRVRAAGRVLLRAADQLACVLADKNRDGYIMTIQERPEPTAVRPPKDLEPVVQYHAASATLPSTNAMQPSSGEAATGGKNVRRARTPQVPILSEGGPGPSGRRPGLRRLSSRDPVGRAFTCPLPHSVFAASRARRLTLSLLRHWGVNGDYVVRAAVVVFELVTNAVCHASAEVRISWKMLSRHGQSSIRVEVADGGPAEGSSPCPDRPAEESGRGTVVIAALASQHGVFTGPDGATVRWAEIVVP